MKDIWSVVLPWIIAGFGGAVGAALLIPTRLGEALITHRFGKALEKLKGEQIKELEKLKEELAHLGDRGKRSNELEFNAVKAVWEQFIEAYHAVDGVTVSFIRAVDLSKMTEDQKRAYLNGHELSDVQRDQVLEAADQRDMLSKILFMRQLANAGQQLFLAHKVIRKERVFLPDALRIKFLDVLDLATGAYMQRKMEHEASTFALNLKGVEEFLDKGASDVDALAGLVRGQLLRSSLRN